MKLLDKQLVLLSGFLVLFSTPGAAQVSPSTPKNAKVRITAGPALEVSRGSLAIITWTCNNPGGSPQHYGIVHYGTNAKDLSHTARSPIRLNPDHPSIVFRVRMDGLEPRTTYYYTVESFESNGKSDGVKSGLSSFTTGPPV